MPTPEQYAEWDALANAILAGRSLSEVDDGVKAAVVSIRAMGPGPQTEAWINSTVSFSQPLTTVLDANNQPVKLDDEPPAVQQYYAKVNAQRVQDAADAAAALSLATNLAPTIAIAPAPKSDNTPGGLSVVGTTAGKSTATGELLVTQPLASHAIVETFQPTGSSSSSSGSSSSSTPAVLAGDKTASVPSVATSRSAAIVVLIAVVVVGAFALGFVHLPKLRG